MTSKARPSCALGVVCSVALAACGSTAAPDASPLDARVLEDAGRPDAHGLRDAGRDASVGCPDGNDTRQTATELPFGRGFSARGAIGCPHDVDYFAFDGAAGALLRLTLVPESVELNLVLTLFDSHGVQLAENDDGLTGTGPVASASAIITRLPADGRYFLAVDSWAHWSGMAESTGTLDDGYLLYGVPLDDDGFAVVDRETGDDAASATPLPDLWYGDLAWVAGTFDDATDVDVFSVRMVDTGKLAVSVHDSGPCASGSTVRPAHVWLTDATGTEVIARTDTSAELIVPSRLMPGLDAGDYLLWLDRSSEQPGGNDFYALSVSWVPENEREVDDAGNGTVEGAESLRFWSHSLGRVAYTYGVLEPGDVDYYAFSLGVGESLYGIECDATFDGSGLRWLQAELHDARDSVLASEAESDAAPLPVLLDATDFGATVFGAGDYYLRLSATGQDPVVTSNFVRCGVLVLGAP
jgi:hypothetical protein